MLINIILYIEILIYLIMVDNLSIKDKSEVFELLAFDKKITQKEIEAFLTESKKIR
jgi:hypothetical protein